MERSSSSSQAFTLIEILITIAIVVAIGVFISINLVGQHNQADLSATASQMAASARQAQVDASSQSKNAVWGIHFSNATNTTPFYAIFTGSSYASGTIQGSKHPLPSDVGYISGTLPSGSSADVTFSEIAGTASTSTDICIYSTSEPSLQEYVYFNSTGQVSYGSTYHNCNGSIGPWGRATALPLGGLDNTAAAAINGYVYVIGGFANNGDYSTSTIFYTKANSDGTLGTWLTTTPLPYAIYYQAPVAANNG